MNIDKKPDVVLSEEDAMRFTDNTEIYLFTDGDDLDIEVTILTYSKGIESQVCISETVGALLDKWLKGMRMCVHDGDSDEEALMKTVKDFKKALTILVDKTDQAIDWLEAGK